MAAISAAMFAGAAPDIGGRSVGLAISPSAWSAPFHPAGFGSAPDLPWLVNGSGTRCESATRKILAAADVEPTVVGDVSDSRLLLALVAEGHGATIVPALVLAHAALYVTISSHDLAVARSLVVVTRWAPSPSAIAVVDRIAAQ